LAVCNVNRFAVFGPPCIVLYRPHMLAGPQRRESALVTTGQK